MDMVKYEIFLDIIERQLQQKHVKTWDILFQEFPR